jgi:hypothetical protein
MSRKIRVRVGPFRRRGFIARRGGKLVRIAAARVRAHTKSVKDVGLPGRTPRWRRVVPKLKPGMLGISFDMPAEKRRKKLIAKTRRFGEKKIVGRLRAIHVLTKRTNPSISSKAKADARYIAGAFVGKKKVLFGKGFRKRH